MSPAGTHVAFVQHNARFNDAARLIVVEVSSRRSLAGNVRYESVESMPWLPDGREVIVLDILEGPSRYRLDGSLTPLAIAGVSASDIPVAWSRDGGLAHSADQHEMPGRICRVDLATGKRDVKYAFGLASLSGVLRWMSPVMARDADAYAYGYFRELSTLYVVEHAR